MPQILKAKISKIQNLAGNYWSFVLEFGKSFDFVSGQYLSVKVAEDGTRRSYSIASHPDNGLKVELVVDVAPMGLGSKYFLSLKEGDEIEVMGPMGVFTTASKSPKTNKMFIATGSGIVPLRAMIKDILLNNKYRGEVQLIWGMRHEEDLFWVDEWQKLNQDFANFSYHIALSKPGEHWHGECGHVGDCLRNGFIVKVPDLSIWEFYLCGSQEMIMETGGYLAGKGVKKEDIHFEKFF